MTNRASVLAAARATVERVSEQQAKGWQGRDQIVPIETRAERWRREADEEEARSAAAAADETLAARTARDVARIERDVISAVKEELRAELASSLKAINKFGEAITEQLGELGAEIEALQGRIAATETAGKIVDARVGDFRGSVEAKASRDDVHFITARMEALRADLDKLALAMRFIELKRLAT
jgi:hypothetical protein